MTSSKPVEDSNEFLSEVNGHLASILAGSAVAYEAGLEIWGLAFEYAPSSPELAYPFWLIWGGLTDAVEGSADDRAAAESKMHRAAREWLDLPAGDEQRNEYLDRWLYDELAYERIEE